MGATIRDIAKKSGVSASTVSRILSNKNCTSSDTVELVRKTAEELNYKLKPTAKLPNKIMLIIGDIQNLFYLGIAKGIFEKLNSGGYMVVILNSNNEPKLEEDYVRLAPRDGYKGIIMITAMETLSLIKLLKQDLCPVVLVNRFIRSMDLNAVCIDNFRGGYMATEYLVKKGHKKIAHLAGPDISTASQDRRRGYQSALSDSGLEIGKNSIFAGDLKRESGYRFGDYYLSKLRDHTAVFCANDIMAAGFITRVMESGLKVPDDVSVICFDDMAPARESVVKLTTVSRDPEMMGMVAGEIMLEVLANSNVKRKVVFPPVMHERNSVKDLLK